MDASARRRRDQRDEACSCTEARRYLDAFLDHEIDDELTARLEEHVVTCPHCSRLADAERHLRAIVRSRCAEQAPPELRARVMTSLSVLRTSSSVTTVRTIRVERG